nr:MAG TPA: hypothetical protein [Caudoviricetes sp.]
MKWSRDERMRSSDWIVVNYLSERNARGSVNDGRGCIVSVI